MSCPAVIEVITPGPPGPIGPAGPAGVGSAWLQGEGAPDAGLGTDGDFYLDTETGDIYGPKADGDWGSVSFNIAEGQQGPAGLDGTDGREVQFQLSATHIQSRYTGEALWTDLIALSALQGPAGADGADGAPGADGSDGREIELQTSATHIQWRYVGSPTWTNLIALAALAGPAGADGSDGADGAPGPAIELQTSATHIQWRVVGASTWTNLITLASLKGDQGNPGADGAAATVTVGTVTTGAAGSPASVSNAGTLSAAVLNFTIPRGDKGDKGDQGDPAPGTDLTYDAATREVRSSTGSDAVLPLVTASAAGLVPAFTSATGKVFTDDGWATPSAGAPAGSSGQLQWNSSGAFAGLSTTSIDGSGNMTFSGRWIQSVNGAASAPGFALTGTWFTGGTTTTTKPHFLIEPAGTTSTNWSTFGTGFGLNAPSGFTGNLLDLQVGGVSRFSVDSANGFAFVNVIRKSRAELSGEVNVAGVALSPFICGIQGTGVFGIASGGSPSNPDTVLARDAAGIFAQRNGTAAQAFRLYNTFTSATNFERLNVRWTTNEAIIDTEAGSGGGTLRGLKIGSASTSLLGFYGATPAVQPAAVADATDASTVITQLNALLSRLRTIGLIAT